LNLLLCCCLYGQGNVVTDWATIVQPAVNTPPRLPGIQFVLGATIQLAVYDAVMAIEGGVRIVYAGYALRTVAPFAVMRHISTA
ncbi:MAG: hypothetical protein ACREMY_20790, partial [bacterium]